MRKAVCVCVCVCVCVLLLLLLLSEIKLLDAVTPMNICALLFVRHKTAQYLLVYMLTAAVSFIWTKYSATAVDVQQDILKTLSELKLNIYYNRR